MKVDLFFWLMLLLCVSRVAETGDVFTAVDYDGMIATVLGFPYGKLLT